MVFGVRAQAWRCFCGCVAATVTITVTTQAQAQAPTTSSPLARAAARPEAVPQSAQGNAATEADSKDPPPSTPPHVAVRAEVTGPASCNSSEYLLEEILRRSSRAVRAMGGEVGWTLRVDVRPQGSRFQAKLTILANEGTWLERELVAPTCNDALEALAVVVSVLVETAVEQEKTRRTVPTADLGNKHEGATGAGSAGGSNRAIPLPYVAGGVWVPWLDDPDYFEKHGVEPVASRYVSSVVATVEVDRQLAPSTTIGLGLGFDVSRWHPNLFNPSYGMSMGWGANDFEFEGRRIELSRLSLRAHLCPIELLRRRTVALRPCARAEAGFVYANYQPLPDPDSTREPPPEVMSLRFGQLRTTPFLRLAWSPLAGAELRLDGGIDFVLYRPRYPLDRSGAGTAFIPDRQAIYAATGLALDW